MTSVFTDRSVRTLLRQGIEHLRARNVPSYTLAAELLLLHVASRDRNWLYSHPEEVLGDSVARIRSSDTAFDGQTGILGNGIRGYS